MNKIVFFVVVLGLYTSLFSQNNNQLTSPLIEKYLVKYKNYVSFDRFQNSGEEEEDYEFDTYMAITNVLSSLEQDIFRLFYANVESKKAFIDHSRQVTLDNPIAHFEIANYYNILQYEGMMFLKQAYNLLLFLQDKYDNIKGALPYVQVSEQEVFDVQVYIKTLQGFCLFCMTGKDNLKKALKSLNFLLGDNEAKIVYANNKVIQERVFKYFIAIYNVLLKKTSNLASFEISDYKASLLYYKWKLVELLNEENKNLKDYKLLRLAKNYYSYMPIKGNIFDTKYKSYVLKLYNLAKDNSALEEKLIIKFGESIFSYTTLNKTTDNELNNSIEEENIE